ncbi:hypothetical protein COT48_06020 [Candidatus Woesearchaeota archaeon CG08_land_8_20_14_0_20_47_9]|nr:MAG: hypothetical protein AUJ69_01065 [Candidatus Woesearchaeota archaeon CG1_02_47_18]PIO03145.1 MAG: hypothetical protein COT48_06020 [Candidatus Woesearchaeota archaeon CG08_land_8_20_14_0_20_47_9]
MRSGSITSRNAQAAMEFLMTYGWAILVVLVVVGALSYFGVLNPKALIPERCTLPSGLTCKDFKITENLASDRIDLFIENGLGRGIKVQQIVVTGPNVKCRNAFADQLVPAGEAAYFAITTTAPSVCVITDAAQGSKEKSSINFVYYYEDSTVTFSHNATGELFAIIN